MKKIIELIKALCIKYKELIMYGIMGVLSTLVNIVSFTIFEKVFGIPALISNVIAWVITVIFAYITNKLYVFNSKTTGKKDLFREIASFFSCRIVTEIISILMMNAAVWFSINDILMKVVSNIVVIILNFVFSKLIIFKNEKKK